MMQSQDVAEPEQKAKLVEIAFVDWEHELGTSSDRGASHGQRSPLLW
jgi:hypothetical protein